MIDPEKFELLSAYLDGEASSAEQALVESWLATDPDLQHYYQAHTRLRQLWQPPVVPDQPPLCSVEKTWRYIESQQQQRWLWMGVTTFAASLIGIMTVSLPFSAKWQQAHGEEPLILALEQPLIPIPKGMLQK